MESYDCLREAVPFLPLLPLKCYFLRMKKFPIFTQLEAQIYAWQHKTISCGEVVKELSQFLSLNSVSPQLAGVGNMEKWLTTLQVEK